MKINIQLEYEVSDMINNQIFVGRKKPKRKHLNPITNREASSKPRGGIWTSPVRESGYSPFETFEGGALIRDNTDAWLLVPNSTQNLLEINNVEELEQLPSISNEHYLSKRTYIDFESVFSRGYDGLKIDGDVAHRKSFSNHYSLQGWDFESIIWNTLSWIDEIKHLGKGKDRIKKL